MSDELSPAERYARSSAEGRERTRHPLTEAFRSTFDYALDPFQVDACRRLEDGESVLVAAPTGAGKTTVAEFAVYLTMRQTRGKIFYTAPMKALSNQKFRELQAVYGHAEVGLLTGDTNINSGARIVVMTTEVLRNMLYSHSDRLNELEFVIMDEVHYLADRFRGAVWEEVIVHLPERVRLVSLSATVSNAEEFGDWLQTVRGDTAVIVSEERPIPLDQHVIVRQRVYDLFEGGPRGDTDRVNPDFVRAVQQASGLGHRGARGGARQGRGPYGRRDDHARMSRADIIDLLDDDDLLPAIFFIFSRAGCDGAVQQCLRAGVRLTTAEEREEIRYIAEERCRSLLDEDLAVLGYWEWIDGLERGVAAHHAGLLPAFKETVEELFQKKLIKVVFATETLALGINMPARTVVLEKLEKFNGEARVPLTPGEYTQLTGRAGRRGIDVEGHAVVQWSEGLNPQSIASLASRRTYPLNSSFRPTYNMAVNLIDQFGIARTRRILEMSFAQFQADRGVVSLSRKLAELSQSLDGYREAMHCHLGDFEEYAALRNRITDLERRQGGPGDRSRAERDRDQAEIARMRRELKHHPCHACSDREAHARWGERYFRLKREVDQLTRQVRTRTGAVARVFDRITRALTELDYVRETPSDVPENPVPRSDESEVEIAADDAVEPAHPGAELTDAGRTLKRIYGERDLLIAECLRRGLWRHLNVPEMAAMAATLVFENRRDEPNPADRFLPQGAFLPALHETVRVWHELDELEERHHLPQTQPLATALAPVMHAWAKGGTLERTLRDLGMQAGDFVRWAKQTIDLLDQLAQVADNPVGGTAKRALEKIRRGVVAYSSVSA